MVSLERQLTIQERAEAYKKAFPKYPPLHCCGRWLYGVWMLGSWCRGTTYHGSYPRTYLKRVISLFSDKKKVLHLFSGSVERDPANSVKFDIRDDVEADVVGDAHELNKHFDSNSFDLIIADPPYTGEDAAKYGVSLIKRHTVLKQCHEILKPGGHLVWLDQTMITYSKERWNLIGMIGIAIGLNRRFRVCCIWEKRGREDTELVLIHG